jgi:hypothetical protein
MVEAMQELLEQQHSDALLRKWIGVCRREVESQEPGRWNWAAIVTREDLADTLRHWTGGKRGGDLPGVCAAYLSTLQRCDLLRDVVGSPFRSWQLEIANPVDRAAVIELARAALDNKTVFRCHLDRQRLNILADALEEFGQPTSVVCPVCDGAGVIDKAPQSRTRCKRCKLTGVVPHPVIHHLRSYLPHCQECWAVALVLGKD